MVLEGAPTEGVEGAEASAGACPAGARLAGAVAALEEVDPASLADTELEELLLVAAAAADKLACAQGRLAAAAEHRPFWRADGSRSFAAWMARRRRGSRACAGAALRLGRSLAAMPATDAAVRGGEVAAEHVRELAACQRFARDRFAESEPLLVGHARTLDFDDFVRVCAAWRNAVDPDGADDDAARRHDRRHLFLHRRPDGTLMIQSGELDPVGAEAFLAELTRIERELFEADWEAAEAECGDDVRTSRLRRTPAQRRADALVEMAHRSRTAPADGKRPAPLVSVYVDYETVSGRLCELASGVPITPGQLLPLFTEADIERVVFGPGNRVIELGKRTRFFTGGLRRAIELRDRRCRFPGCDEPAARCHVDHRVPHAEGGDTTQENGWLQCERHNQWRNAHGGDPPDEPISLAEARRLVRQRLRKLRPPPFVA